jgi:hypothetical protein
MAKRFIDHGSISYAEFFKLLEEQKDYEKRNGKSGTGEGMLRNYRFGNYGARFAEDQVIER